MTSIATRARLVGRPAEGSAIAHEFDDQAHVGRSPDNDVVVPHPFLSGRHARVYRESGAYWVEDLGSRNGTRVDGVAITAPARLDRLHVITLADTVDLVFVRDAAAEGGVPAAAALPAGAAGGERTAELTRFDIDFAALVDPRGSDDVAAASGAPAPRFGLVLVHATGRQEDIALHDGDNLLGRSEDCDVALPDPERWLGRQHATVRVAPDGVQLIDQGSMNGTFIDGRAIQTAVLEPGVTFRLGPYLELTLVRR